MATYCYGSKNNISITVIFLEVALQNDRNIFNGDVIRTNNNEREDTQANNDEAKIKIEIEEELRRVNPKFHMVEQDKAQENNVEDNLYLFGLI